MDAVADIELEWSHGRMHFPNGVNHPRILRFSLCQLRRKRSIKLHSILFKEQVLKVLVSS